MTAATKPSSLAELDKRHVWHPFTPMQEWADSAPLVIEAADGNYLVDERGTRYLDGVSSLWVNVHGHNHPRINRAIRAQLDRVAHTTLLGLASGPSIELAHRLAALSPGALEKVFYSDSGSTAVEIALKQAFQYWQLTGRPEKHRFVHLEDAYHGDTLGAVGVGGIDVFHQIFGPLLVSSLSVPTPYRCAKAGATDAGACALELLEELFVRSASEIAALIIEPLVQGAAGMLVQPPGYLKGVEDLCRKHGVLLIVDEVATGFGRTGRMFACEHEGVEPDFLCLAKGISGGYLPLAATLTTDRIYKAFLGRREERKTFFHGHTYTGNPLACAAALASLEVFEENRVLERCQDRIHRLTELLDEHIVELAWVQEVRQQGLMVGIELADPRTGEGYPASMAMGVKVCDAAREHGVIVRPLGDVVVLMPPLSITDSELEQLVLAVCSASREVCG